MTVVLKPVSPNGVVVPTVFGDKLVLIEALVFSSTYKTGGDTALAKEIEIIFKENGGGLIRWIQVSGVPGYLFIYNYETNKLQVYQSGKESAILKELPEAEYPAAIREGKPRLFAIGR